MISSSFRCRYSPVRQIINPFRRKYVKNESVFLSAFDLKQKVSIRGTHSSNLRIAYFCSRWIFIVLFEMREKAAGSVFVLRGSPANDVVDRQGRQAAFELYRSALLLSSSASSSTRSPSLAVHARAQPTRPAVKRKLPQQSLGEIAGFVRIYNFNTTRTVHRRVQCVVS